MEASIEQFVQRVFAGDPDYESCKLKLCNISPCENIFKKAAQKNSRSSISDDDYLNSSVDQCINGNSSQYLLDSVEKGGKSPSTAVSGEHYAGALVAGTPLEKSNNKTAKKRINSFDGDDDNSDPETLMILEEPLNDDYSPPYTDKSECNADAVHVSEKVSLNVSESGSGYLNSSIAESVNAKNSSCLSSDVARSGDLSANVTEDLDVDIIDSPLKKANNIARKKRVYSSDDSSDPEALVIQEEPPMEIQNSMLQEKSPCNIDEFAIKTGSNKKKLPFPQTKKKKISVDEMKYDLSSSDDEIIHTKQKRGRKRQSIMRAFSDESNDDTVQETSFSQEGNEQEEVSSGENSDGYSLEGKKQEVLKQKVSFSQNKKPRVLVRKLSIDCDSNSVTLSALNKRSEEKNSLTNDDTDLESVESDSNETLQENSVKQSIKKSTEDVRKTGSSSKENDSDGSTSSVKKKKSRAKTVSKEEPRVSSTNAKIERLKKYINIAGIHVQSYNKLWESCKSLKSKADKLLELLQKNGLKGHPTIEKCKKLKKKIEKKKEIEELDLNNIIKSEGRPKRNARSMYLNPGQQVDQPVQKSLCDFAESDESNPQPLKRFLRLKDIIDSEESD